MRASSGDGGGGAGGACDDASLASTSSSPDHPVCFDLHQPGCQGEFQDVLNWCY
jgi:hypothetical protein